MANKITIIGAGSVGSTIAYSLANRTIASDIVIIDINKSADGTETDVVGENNVVELDCKKALAACRYLNRCPQEGKVWYWNCRI